LILGKKVKSFFYIIKIDFINSHITVDNSVKKSKSKVQNMKKGYLIVRINISNAELFQQYPPLSTKAVEKFGGKYLIRGGAFEVVEGKWPAERTTVVEFESFDKAKEFYNSLEYNEAKKVRKESADTDFILIEGY
jgi:uncharacterized protein (DUF1330 family)